MTGSAALVASLYFSRVVHPNYLIPVAVLLPLPLLARRRRADLALVPLLLLALAVEIAEQQLFRTGWEQAAAAGLPARLGGLLAALAPKAGPQLTPGPAGPALQRRGRRPRRAVPRDRLRGPWAWRRRRPRARLRGCRGGLARLRRRLAWRGGIVVIAALLVVAVPTLALVRVGDRTGLVRAQDPAVVQAQADARRLAAGRSPYCDAARDDPAGAGGDLLELPPRPARRDRAGSPVAAARPVRARRRLARLRAARPAGRRPAGPRCARAGRGTRHGVRRPVAGCRRALRAAARRRHGPRIAAPARSAGARRSVARDSPRQERAGGGVGRARRRVRSPRGARRARARDDAAGARTRAGGPAARREGPRRRGRDLCARGRAGAAARCVRVPRPAAAGGSAGARPRRLQPARLSRRGGIGLRPRLAAIGPLLALAATAGLLRLAAPASAVAALASLGGIVLAPAVSPEIVALPIVLGALAVAESADTSGAST